MMKQRSGKQKTAAELAEEALLEEEEIEEDSDDSIDMEETIGDNSITYFAFICCPNVLKGFCSKCSFYMLLTMILIITIFSFVNFAYGPHDILFQPDVSKIDKKWKTERKRGEELPKDHGNVIYDPNNFNAISTNGDIQLVSSINFNKTEDRTIKNTYIIDDIVTFKNEVGIPCIHSLTDWYGIHFFGIDSQVFPSQDKFIINGSFLRFAMIIYFVEVRVTRINWQQEYRIDAIVGNQFLYQWPFLKDLFTYLKISPLIMAQDLVDCIDKTAPSKVKLRDMFEFDPEQVLAMVGIEHEEHEEDE